MLSCIGSIATGGLSSFLRNWPNPPDMGLELHAVVFTAGMFPVLCTVIALLNSRRRKLRWRHAWLWGLPALYLIVLHLYTFSAYWGDWREVLRLWWNPLGAPSKGFLLATLHFAVSVMIIGMTLAWLCIVVIEITRKVLPKKYDEPPPADAG